MNVDSFDLPPDSISGTQIFVNPSPVAGAATPLQVWHKPRRARMLYIMAISGGGGGGHGLTNSVGTARGGGGGGGASSCSRAIYPAIFIPDLIYIQVGAGGAGGSSSGVAGASGGLTYVMIEYPTFGFGAGGAILQSGTAAPTGGAAGTAAGSNAGGSPGSALAAAQGLLHFHAAIWSSVQGNSGNNAGASGAISGANGANGTTSGPSGGICSPGAGGGTVGTNNTDFAGGGQTYNSISIAAKFPVIPGGAAGGVAGSSGWNPFGTGSMGADYGLSKIYPWFFNGGCGGGTNGAAGVGGTGGHGSIGSGGGGGGGGVTGGRGGNGGSGMVLISWW